MEFGKEMTYLRDLQGESDLSSCYERSNDIDLLIRSVYIKNISESIVQSDKRFTSTCCTIGNKILIILVASKKFLLIFGKRFNLFIKSELIGFFLFICLLDIPNGTAGD